MLEKPPVLTQKTIRDAVVKLSNQEVLSTIADINNDSVRGATSGEAFFDDIRDEVMLFSRSKEVQAMLLDEDFARLDWNSNYQSGVERGLEQGRTDLIQRMLKNGKTEEEIAAFCDYPIEEIHQIAEKLSIPT